MSDLYYDWIKTIPVLTHEEEITLAKRYRSGDKKAGDKLIEHNLRLVLKVAEKQAKTSKVAFEDLVQEGNIGLMKAIEGYDPDLGWKFSTYAIQWIEQKIKRYIYQYNGTIRTPAHLGLKIRKIQVAEKNLEIELQRLPNSAEIAQATGYSERTVIELMKISGDCLPLDMNLENDEGRITTLADRMANVTAPDPADEYEQIELQQLISTIMEELTPKERDVITLVFGLDGKRKHTLIEVGEKYDVTRERIRQIKLCALRKFNYYERKNKLKAFY